MTRRHLETTRGAAALLALLVMLLAASPARAEEEEYLIGGGDVLQVNVWKNAELSQTVTVRPDGKITLPLVRDVTASGLTAVALGTVVATKLAAFVNAPNVTVTVTTASSYRVYTQGAVATGMHVLPAPTTARQLLSRAGGPLPEADLARAYVRRGGETLPVDLSLAPPPAGDHGTDLPLSAGDVLVVPFREVTAGRVLVVGAVERPQALPFQEGLTVLDAYLGVGGGLPTADLRGARIARLQHGGKEGDVAVNLEELLRGGSLQQNVTLRAGDILVVPSLPALERVIVVGEVRTPRALEYVEGLTVLDAYVEAGGGTEFADLRALRVVRRPRGGKSEELPVDLDRVLKRGELGANIALRPGDIVVVPR